MENKLYPFNLTAFITFNIIELIFARMDAAIILMGRLSGGTGQFNYSFDGTQKGAYYLEI